ncbi:hypothetical protein SKTS_33120 [Sulfurimicrobium lacus]|uniref:Mor transcription activator domain-containing protein n=1 Tax=Sulfurimicrobium lacus TaxID=2715678 RepID=A0A6F8VHC4_9PROT|nr:hypothetical protein [Sulfurimicrobium lacus]BCB28426.1 hypothetical protein SKTS_33120 [Sulfurimicrobium lacus]
MGIPRHRRNLPAAPQPEDAASFPAVDDELLRTLPPLLRAVVRALGFGRAREWLAEHGGVNVTLPARRTQALLLEADELARLRHTLAPHLDAAGRCWMPKADKLFIRVRDAQIRKDRPATSVNALARRENLSSRQILNICREDDERQFDLF